MNWKEEAKVLFKAEKPAHFTDFTHCEECAEHDQTLIHSSIDSLGFEDLCPGWDPLCFCSVEGKKYYMPSFIRISIDTADSDFYFGQLLFYLEGDGENNDLFLGCSTEQRKFIASFVGYMINLYPEILDTNFLTDNALRVHEIWSKV